MRISVLKRIHVNQHVIRSNRREGQSGPPLTVKTSRSNTKGHHVEILGPARVVYRPEKPLPCGARVWIETRAQVLVMDADGLLVGRLN